jgi:hypothetical protein
MKEKFSPGDWEELKVLPFTVFNMVAAADGEIDQKEVAQVAQELMKAPSFKDQLHRELMMDVAAGNWQEVLKKSFEVGNIEQRLNNAKTMLKQALSDEEYSRFLGSLIISGGNIARASGGGFLGLGDKVSDEEKKVLIFLTGLFEIDLGVVARSFGQP